MDKLFENNQVTIIGKISREAEFYTLLNLQGSQTSNSFKALTELYDWKSL